MSDITGPPADAAPASLGIPAELWEVLACPCPDHAALEVDVARGRIVCTKCRRSFEVRDGIPVMLLDEAENPAGPTNG
jgi:uncharacterized protein YbaR (Trm112 family)